MLREQLRAPDSPHASPEEVAQRVAEIRKQYPKGETETGWQALLQSYGLSERDLLSRVAAQIDLMSLVDSRLRPAVNIDNKSIESYHQQELGRNSTTPEGKASRWRKCQERSESFLPRRRSLKC